MDRVCVIGAGSSGIAAAKVLHERGIPFDCFEKGSHVGGNWRIDNDNGMSSAYESLFINTSKRLMEYPDFPMPDDYPDYPHHTQIARYFDAYVDHFGFRDEIRFRTEVTRVEPAADGWEVTFGDGASSRYGAVMVANGHHWDPRWPEPPFPGQEGFTGEQLHSHFYRRPDERFRDRSVLVLGVGNSAVDIACETSRCSRMTFLAMRRGAHVIPKYIGGAPTDELGSELFTRLPFRLQRALFARKLRQVQGEMEAYGLPRPDHELGQAHPTISSELLPRIGHGRITPKPNIEQIDGGTVRFVDGTSEQIDTIVWCTGYRISFPFLAPELIDTRSNRAPLYRNVVHPERPGLFFIGLLQPLGAIMPLAAEQSEWVADLLQGRAALPEPSAMRRTIARDDARRRRRYVASPRHTIQVDFHPYLRTLRRERRRRGGGRVHEANEEERQWPRRRPRRRHRTA